MGGSMRCIIRSVNKGVLALAPVFELLRPARVQLHHPLHRREPGPVVVRTVHELIRLVLAVGRRQEPSHPVLLAHCVEVPVLVWENPTAVGLRIRRVAEVVLCAPGGLRFWKVLRACVGGVCVRVRCMRLWVEGAYGEWGKGVEAVCVCEVGMRGGAPPTFV